MTHPAKPTLGETKSPNPDPLYDEKAAAAYLTTAEQTLANWRTTGRYSLRFIRVGRLIRYRKSDLDAFIEARAAGVSGA